ncbi:short chain dehydrogenase reductase family protein [Cystoisospora suis]|uniref:Short chain dehydrogenase reductase family protein n=1 Tax=Cystoisospora suis TaxID=483139 RepID=A0A2C6L255_9APIC|nr:short chain dehydrogenase reductase family protein [Cystoisospora suis]
MGNTLMPLLWFHRPGHFTRTGVYADPVSPLPYLSLLTTEPCLQASAFAVATFVLVLLLPWITQFTVPEFSFVMFTSFSAFSFFCLHTLPEHLLSVRDVVQKLLASLCNPLLPPRVAVSPVFSQTTQVIVLTIIILSWFRLLRRIAGGFRLPPPHLKTSWFPCPCKVFYSFWSSLLSTARRRRHSLCFSTEALVDSVFSEGAVKSRAGCLPSPEGEKAFFLPLKGKTAVVTGGAGGIGRETARQLALWGAHVLIGCRDTQVGKRVAKDIESEIASLSPSTSSASRHPGRVSVAHLDLCVFPSVRSFASFSLLLFKDRIDILVNNAGVMMLPQLTVVDECGGFEKQFVTNHLGHFLLSLLLLPGLKAASGRIINVSSCAHIWHAKHFRPLDAACTPEASASVAQALAKPLDKLQGRPPVTPVNYDKRAAYGNSKLANIWFTKELQRRLIAEAVGGDGKEPEASHNCVKGHAASGTDDRRENEETSGHDNSASGVGETEQETTKGNHGESLKPLPAGVVGVYAVHPGNVHTQLMRHMVATSKVQSLLIGGVLAHTVMKTAKDGAASQLLLCVVDKNLLLPGGFYADGGPSWVVEAANDSALQEELWNLSEVVCFGGVGKQNLI